MAAATRTLLLHAGRVCGLVATALAAAVACAAPDPLPGPPQFSFVPPTPGTYALPVIQRAPFGIVLDGEGRTRALSQFTTGKVTLLSFIYTYCRDATGCPLAHTTMTEVRGRFVEQPALRDRVRFVSLSFDPLHDLPHVMKAFSSALAGTAPVQWSFLTTSSLSTLAPLLDGFGQEIAVESDAQGRPTRTLAHMLKVFLLDRKGQVREIYSTAFLAPQVVLNDMLTLLLEDGAKIP